MQAETTCCILHLSPDPECQGDSWGEVSVGEPASKNMKADLDLEGEVGLVSSEPPLCNLPVHKLQGVTQIH